MKNLKDYNIPFSGLSLGKHEFEFEVGDAFFELLESADIKKGSLKADVTLNKQNIMLILDFHIEGNVVVTCDRCADEFEMPVTSDNQLIVKFGNSTEEDTDEIITIPEAEHDINVAQFIYEFINLALPIQRVHPVNEKGESQCDPEVLKKLQEISVKKKQDDIDPRWDALRKLN